MTTRGGQQAYEIDQHSFVGSRSLRDVRLAILASHPIQYQSPLFRELARRIDLTVFYAHRATPSDQARAGFGVDFDWDLDLLSGFHSSFLPNVAQNPGLDRFSGCDTPAIADELRNGQYDALLVMGWHLKCFVQAVWSAKRLGVRVMVRGDSQLATPRSFPKRASKRLVYPIALRTFDAALYVGARSRAYYEHYGYPADRLFFSPHCVDNDWFAERATEQSRQSLRSELGLQRTTKVVIFAGKIIALKRPLDLVHAVARAAPDCPDIAILVAGSGPLAGDMADRAAKLNIRLIDLGFCNQTRMPSVYAAGDILVLPSDSETWGLVANEAIACGRPAVVSEACGCAPDLAGDRTVARAYPVGNVEMLAAALKETLAVPPPRDAIARLAAKYSIGAAADGIQEAAQRIERQKVGPLS